MHGVGLFGLILFGTLCFLDLDVSYQTGKFSASIFLNWFPVSSGIPMILMLVYLMLFWRSLKLSFYNPYFYFCWSDWLISTNLCPSSLTLLHQQICWFPLVYFWFQLVFNSDRFLYFSLSKFSMSSSVLFLSALSTLITSVLNSISFSSFFVLFCPVLLFGTYFSVSCIWCKFISQRLNTCCGPECFSPKHSHGLLILFLQISTPVSPQSGLSYSSDLKYSSYPLYIPILTLVPPVTVSLLNALMCFKGLLPPILSLA